MFRPARMLQLNVLVLDKDVDQATTAMIKSGLVHLVSVAGVQHWADEAQLQAVPKDVSPALSEISDMARSIAEKLSVSPQIFSEGAAFQQFDPTQAKTKLQEILKDVNPAFGERYTAWQKLASLRQARQHATVDIRTRFGLDVRSPYTMLDIAIGFVPESNVDFLKRLLSPVPNVVLTFPEGKGKVSVMAIVLKRDSQALKQACEKVQFEQAPPPEKKSPDTQDIVDRLDDRIAQAQKELDQAQSALDQCRDTHLPALRMILSQVSLQQLARSAKENFGKTARTYLISGWTPRRTRDQVIQALKSACRNRCLIEETTAEEILAEGDESVEVPIVLQNPRVIQPFEMLVSGYGAPAYNSVDPTVVVAPIFLLMYGAMFGDVGQGVVLAALGALLWRSKKLTHSIRKIGQLLIWCGAAAVLFGCFYGSVFGFRNVLPYRGFEPLDNVSVFLTVALFFGMAMITLGLLLNVFYAISRRQWASGLLEWKGLMGLAFYWLGIALMVQVRAGRSPSRTLIVMLLAMPVLSALLMALTERRAPGQLRRVDGAFPSRALRSLGHIVGECFDTILQFIANTVSFLRLAAFAIAHAALFNALFSLAEMLRGAGPTLPILVHVVGNAGMIALEGLVVSVQALRLTYYEFFGKFFRVGRTRFSPVKLPSTVS